MADYRNAINLVLGVISKNGADLKNLNDLLDLCIWQLKDNPNDREYCFKYTDYIKKCAKALHIQTLNEEFGDLYWRTMLFESQNKVLDSYLMYLEKNRPYEERFYEPKRKQFMKIGLIQALQDLLDDKLDILSISLPPGTGKALALNSKVLTPNGFVKNSELKVGDKVIAANGNVSTVLGVYPQGVKPMYDVIFDDGSKCRCSDEHLWTVQTREDRKNKKYRTIELKEILKNYRVENGKRHNYSIDYVGKIDFSEKEYVIHPYVLGALLGDGGFSQNCVNISTSDMELLDKVNSLLPENHEFKHKSRYDYTLHSNRQRNVIKQELVNLGLQGKRSYEKFIPLNYMYGSYEQRLWLLRGILDTDAYSSEHDIEYSTSSKELAINVCELVHSLGAYCSITEKTNCGYKDKNGNFVKCKNSYVLHIVQKKDAEPFFYIKRKKDKFKPKRQEIKRFITDIVYVGEEECQCIYIDDESHLYITDDYIITHNTTLEKFFHSAVIGWFPTDFNLFYSHSSDITRMYYDGVYDIVTNNIEYTWGEIFPGLSVTSQNAKMEQFNIGKYKPFPSVQCTSVGSKNAGKVRANRFLLCDDLIGGIEEALNKNRLDSLWNVYSVDARQRKIPGCKEIHIATRWSVHDVIGRLQRLYNGSNRVKFIAVPDIDPITGESNFSYDVNGFDVNFFKDQQLAMDDISYRCLYKNEPIEREGMLYHEDDLRRYSSLPLREPDAILGICDVKNKGTDFMFLPCFYQYDEDYYLVDCVCDDNTDYGVQYERLSNLIVEHNMQQCEFESNSGGDRVSFEVNKLVEKKGGRCNITDKPTETNKETRIIVNADWIKKHVLFRDKENYKAKDDYGIMMSWLLCYSTVGKNVHDDVPDGMANFALYVTSKKKIAKVEVVHNPFWGGYR